MQNAAAELYALESQRPFTREQNERWQVLAQLVFARSHPGELRASSRMRGRAQVRIVLGDEKTCEVVDASWGGLRLSNQLPDGAEVRLTGVRRGGAWSAVDLACRVVQGGWAITLVDRDPQRRHDYFVTVYYPLYMDHLRSLAGIGS